MQSQHKNPSNPNSQWKNNRPNIAITYCPKDPPPLSIHGSDHDSLLAGSHFITRQELLLRRSRRLKQLASFYRTHYWALVDHLRIKYREYYWRFGISPFVQDEDRGAEREGAGECASTSTAAVAVEGSGENGIGWNKYGCRNCGEGDWLCSYSGCKSKAMALTSYCHQHILSDKEQKLYKACGYVIKSSQTGSIICGKPVLKAALPSLCTVHFQASRRNVSQALKKAGFDTSSSSKLAPKFHAIIAEYVHQIQAKRREVRKATSENAMVRSLSIELFMT